VWCWEAGRGCLWAKADAAAWQGEMQALLRAME
jgi:hypothetical protein